jgi:hypothetical protein
MTFSDEQVAAIRARRAAGESYAGIALDYGCHKNAIRSIAKNISNRAVSHGDSIVGRMRRTAIIDMLRASPMTTGQIREKMGVDPYPYLTQMHKKGIIEHKTVWVIK